MKLLLLIRIKIGLTLQKRLNGWRGIVNEYAKTATPRILLALTIHRMAADKVFSNMNSTLWIMPPCNLGIIKSVNNFVAFI